ncbi:hypothetical protein SAMN05660337_1945 [Maridesulfovibrio ferrireducens]|uniref:Uncharacterized protein n=1 Tax=Maridesulfovibrio ferrireducens TaxID=246191 RepID=A0A1G9GZQ5_9BACT|nr:hypothetical protein [Maridesulfovibrio ferrireducens]SDL06147.1 hypothetical protein SAMN05660337_1945 [Maridesulfovibrio ferrireducens]
MKIFAGTDGLNIPDLFYSASRRIILNGAVYGPFAKSERHQAGLDTALNKPEFQRFDIIAIEPELNFSWKESFLGALRFGISRQATEEEIKISHTFLTDLEKKYPDKIRIHPARNLPCTPVIVVDDTICFGQYAHAEPHAPEGFWGMVEADVEKLIEWTKSGRPPSSSTKKEIAAFRLINECARSMNLSGS